MKHGIVIDTSTLLGAILPGSVPRQAFLAALKSYTLVQNAKTMAELEDVTNRRRIIDTYGASGIRQLVRDVSQEARFITQPLTLDSLPADAKDTRFLELAAASGARVIISSDKHLLALKHFSLKGKPPVQIWTPKQFRDHEEARKQVRLTRGNMFAKPS